MPFDFAARKFSRAKWVRRSFINDDDDIPADAITSCLRTSDNKLSFWECNQEQHSIEDVVLALATAPKSGTPEKMHIIAFEKDTLNSAGLVFARSDGDTETGDLRERHLDLIELTLNKISVLAKIMRTQIDADRYCHSFSKQQVAKILKNAVTTDRIALDKLAPDWQAELRKTK